MEGILGFEYGVAPETATLQTGSGEKTSWKPPKDHTIQINA